MLDMKIRAQMAGDITDIKALLTHPMENGRRKDMKTGQIVPLHFIQTMTVSVAGKTVIDAQLSAAVSKNPYFAFKVKGAKAGDKVVLNWVDNKGEKATGEATVA